MGEKIDDMEVLQDLVDQDQSNHRIKSMAELLLSAMNDWPTDVQIDKFVVEFKKYFGVPLTLEKMKEKKFDGSNAWQLEASGSIELLINMSSEFNNEKDLDKIVENIFNHYKLTYTDS